MASVTQRETIYKLDARLTRRRWPVTHIIQLEKVSDIPGVSSMMLPPDADWVLTERYLPDYIDATHRTGVSEIGAVTRVLATSSQQVGVKHFELHLFARAYMGSQLAPLDFGPNNCACPTGEADLKWKENFYLPNLCRSLVA